MFHFHPQRTLPLLFALIASVALSSCASLNGFFGGKPHDEEAELAERDPVAAMALKLRRARAPASALAAPEQLEADEMRLTMARSRGDVAVGMSMSDVRSLWGEPREIEKAGEPGSGNERWTYFEGLSSPWSLSTARRIYFESGRVTGWDTLNP